MLFPREAAQIDDVWQVLGLRGTGSDSYSVTDMFIADAYSVTRDREEERQEDGVLYRFTTSNMYASGFGAVGLGIARAMLDGFTALAAVKTAALSPAPMRDSAVVQSLIAVSDAQLRSAGAWLIQVLTEVRESVARSGRMTLQEKLDIRQASTFAIHQAREVVNAVGTRRGRRRFSTRSRSSGDSATCTRCPSRCRGGTAISRRSASSGWGGSQFRWS